MTRQALLVVSGVIPMGQTMGSLAAALTPMLVETCQQQGFPEPPRPLFVALLLGASLGGRATVIGASANLVAAGLSRPLAALAELRRLAPTITDC